MSQRESSQRCQTNGYKVGTSSACGTFCDNCNCHAEKVEAAKQSNEEISKAICPYSAGVYPEDPCQSCQGNGGYGCSMCTWY